MNCKYSLTVVVYQMRTLFSIVFRIRFEKILKEGGVCMKYKFVSFITLKNGKRIYAKDYGLRAFRIRVNR